MVQTLQGGKLRRLRMEHRLSQAQMAHRLEISPTYLNLLEHNQRPVTAQVLLKLTRQFEIDIAQFTSDDEPRLLSDVTEALSDPLFDVHGIKAADVKEAVTSFPTIGRAILTLYQAARTAQMTKGSDAQKDQVSVDAAGELTSNLSGMPSEEVSDFLHANSVFPDALRRWNRSGRTTTSRWSICTRGWSVS